MYYVKNSDGGMRRQLPLRRPGAEREWASVGIGGHQWNSAGTSGHPQTPSDNV